MKLDISIEITKALIDLHSGKVKVSHNDTSPMNILMNLDEKEPGYIDLKKLVLADFGISTVMKNSTYSITLKKVSGGNGNPGYIAPEVWKNNSYFHIKTDVYSFGRLINHLFFSPDNLVLENNKDG